VASSRSMALAATDEANSSQAMQSAKSSIPLRRKNTRLSNLRLQIATFPSFGASWSRFCALKLS